MIRNTHESTPHHRWTSDLGRAIARTAFTYLVLAAASMPARGDLTITIVGVPGAGECYWRFEGSSSQWSSDNGSNNLLYGGGAGLFPGLAGNYFRAPGGAIAPIARVEGNECYGVRNHADGIVLLVSGLSCQSTCFKTVEGTGETRIVPQDITQFTQGVQTFGATTVNVIYCTSGDSDGDGIPDDCDQCPGSDDWDDWDHNGVPDGCELDAPYSIRLGHAGTLCNGNSFLMTNQPYFPSASGDVTITCTMDTLGMAAADANVEVYGNGVLLGTLFEGAITGGCSQSDSIAVNAAQWELARQPNGSVQIELQASASAVCGACSGFSFTYVDIAYMTDRDVNDNGVVDVRPGDCDPTGADADGDGIGDACDLCPGTAAGTPVDGDGCTLAPTNADLDRDGDVDDEDMAGFFICAGAPDSPAAGGCAPFDRDADGDVDLVDFLALQDAASGAGFAAEASSGGTILPRYFGADIGHAVSFDNASRMCHLRFGSTLAMIDSQLPVDEQQSRIEEMTAIANALGGGGYWIGLRYHPPTQRFIWRDGSSLIPEDGPATNWSGDGQTPTAGDFSGGSQAYYVQMWSAAGYKWINYEDDEFSPGFDPTGCMCDAPDVFKQGMPAGEEAGNGVLDVQIISYGGNSVLVGPGENVAYEVSGLLSDANNEGLAGFAFDLSFDGGDLTPATVPSNMESFAGPQGYNNPAGFGGTVVNGDLIQVGGGQNTMNFAGPDGPAGTVTSGIGQSTSILATGTFVAPTTPGTYTLSLSNLNAATINAGQAGMPVWRCEPALPGTITNLTVVVCAAGNADHDEICDDADSCITTNDNCVDATPIGDETLFGCTMGATNDGFASCGSSAFSPDVWYVYSAPFDGTATADTCGAGTNYDTVLSVLDGCGGAQLICDNDGCGFPSNSSRVTWEIVQGRPYLIRVAGWFGAVGNFELTVSSTAFPANDDCNSAIAVSAGTYTGSTIDAKFDPTGPCNTQWVQDVWFSYTNSVGVDVELTADLCSASTTADTILGVYDGCGGSEIACNDNAGNCPANNMASSLNWIVPCGQTHLIRVASHTNSPGDFQLTVSEIPVGPDSDNDGVGDSCDLCPGFDDNIDSDGDGIPDGCDAPCGALQLGDIDGSGTLDVADAAVFSTVLLSPEAVSDDQGCAADMNQDGRIDGLDIQVFVNKLLTQ